ncbi:uncharacterized protein LOC133379197 [Rhineura floridana]|uniref:uncharacterized protein LOC133379197 n=1 Tax=Rhineura floridana TaxID=261503 RepID=UPI002AC8082F|nr:uncharacterized protein LOC133379197 [Rhineura floridana]
MAAGHSGQLDAAAGSSRFSHDLWLWAKAQILALHPPPHGMGSNTCAAVQSETTSRGTEGQPATSSWVTNPVKTTWNQQQLHRELLFTHRKGLSLRSKPELLQVLEHRNRCREGTESGLEQSPLEQELLRWQQRREQNQQQEETGDKVGNQPEFIRVRENLRRTHHSQDLPPQHAAPSPISSPLLRPLLTNRQPSRHPATHPPVVPKPQVPQLQSSLKVSSPFSAPSQCPLANT